MPLVAAERLVALVCVAADLPADAAAMELDASLQQLEAFARHAAERWDELERGTRAEQADRALYRSQQLSVTGQLAATVSHEVRNPLAAIRSLVQFVRDADPEPADRRRILDGVVEEVDRIESTLGRHLDLSRPHLQTHVDLDVGQLAATVVELMRPDAKGRGVHLEFHGDGSLLRVLADPAELRQVLVNVLLNARQACADGRGRHVSVRAEPRETPDGSRVAEIVVTDDGPGIEVLYRRGYYARPEPLTYDRQALLTDARMASAAGYRAVITDLPLTISASTVTVTGDGGELLVQIRVAPDAVTFTAADGRYAAALDIALYVGDRNRQQIGELRKRVDLNLTRPTTHASPPTASRSPPPCRTQGVPATSRPSCTSTRRTVWGLRCSISSGEKHRAQLTMTMGPRIEAVGRRVLISAALWVAAGAGPLAQDRQVFRAATALVPVEVRVLDREGQPVRGLERSDFSIFEDGVRQQIQQFAVRDFEAPLLPIPAGAERDDAQGIQGRTFAIVLGRGRLQGPAKGLDALVDFIRRDALPADRFALVAYERTTGVGADREWILRLLERYKAGHEGIDLLLSEWFTGSTEIYGDRRPHTRIQERIDALLQVPGYPAMRQLALLPPPGDGQIQEDYRRLLDTVGQGEGGGRRGFTYLATARHDLERLHATIEHLRPLEGEKHLIFVTAHGFLASRRDLADRLGTAAADAGVTLSSIHTGGFDTDWHVQELQPQIVQMAFLGMSWEQRWAAASSRDIAERTGGIASIFRYAADGLASLERAARLTYVIGYVPARAPDDSYRRLEVRVDRPNVQVLHRRTYYARAIAPSYDHRAYVTGLRVAAARAYRGSLDEVPFKAAAARGADGNQAAVVLDITILPSALTFLEKDGKRSAHFTVSIAVGDVANRTIGDLERQFDLALSPESYDEVARNGFSFRGTVPVKGQPRHAKVVVYDYTSDLVGARTIAVSSGAR